MKCMRIVKRVLACMVFVCVLMTSIQNVYCTEYWFDDRTLGEYIKKHQEEAAKAGYTSRTTYDGKGSESNVSSQEPKTGAEEKKQVKTCEHTYVDTIINEPTCAEPGIMESKCSKCGDSYKTEIPATGKHEYSSEVTKEATCTEKGETTYTCKVCGDSYTEEIPMLEHSYDSLITKDPTCLEAGIRTYTCSLCGDSYTEEIAATGHVEVEEVTKEAGIFTQGERIVRCSVCGEIISSEVIPSKYPVQYLYAAIACIAVILSVILALLLRKRKHGTKTIRKTA